MVAFWYLWDGKKIREVAGMNSLTAQSYKCLQPRLPITVPWLCSAARFIIPISAGNAYDFIHPRCV